ncbi:hypothetical protein CIMG_00013 [Paecilomyces variotii No. 5]|uniref:Uncharacterized protein n=1 Tax=Byssochlamys spectabilis (strain No. 5 / NBRC 109023) TaxID=1356009 RepID=V5FRQ1_BYSSN|nr:hypothetical protein CIMG_00013 [Paecilomyces variotii No. 5]
MDSPRLYVAFYRPHYGNFIHWALAIEHGDTGVTIQVIGEHPEFERNTIDQRAEDNEGFLNKLFVGVISEADIGLIKALASSQPVDNETVEWDCQDYVLEFLDKLEKEYVLDADDEEYREARQELKKRRGATY